MLNNINPQDALPINKAGKVYDPKKETQNGITYEMLNDVIKKMSEDDRDTIKTTRVILVKEVVGAIIDPSHEDQSAVLIGLLVATGYYAAIREMNNAKPMMDGPSADGL